MTSLIEYLCERIKSSYEFNNHYRCLLNELATSFFEKINVNFFFLNIISDFYTSANTYLTPVLNKIEQ